MAATSFVEPLYRIAVVRAMTESESGGRAASAAMVVALSACEIGAMKR